MGHERRGFERIKRMVGEQKTKGKVIHNWEAWGKNINKNVLTKIQIKDKVEHRKRARNRVT